MAELTLSHWGVNAILRDGAGAPRLAPWAGDPDPSPIGAYDLADVDRLRVRRPAVRRSFLAQGHRSGGVGRGREPFVEVPWDEALDIVAGELARVKREHGNGAIFGGSYGWASAGRFHHSVGQLHRFLNALGGYVRHTDTYSRHNALERHLRDVLCARIHSPQEDTARVAAGRAALGL